MGDLDWLTFQKFGHELTTKLPNDTKKADMMMMMMVVNIHQNQLWPIRP